ncbi:immunoglobulin superfamily member 5 [Rhinoderma darwinii]|uniref:immunoglobulin superfamily member 5 n=1 Tax=Rhinoderma darwinii TaxID=43563 RepID=UPI003F663FC1
MDGYRTNLIWITILCLIQDYGSCSDIIEGPTNFTVLSGSNASFLCTVGSQWQSISWYLQNTFIVSITPTGTTVSKDFIIVQNSTNSITGAFTSEITIVNVNKSNSGIIGCSSLNSVTQDAYLSVQVNGSIKITNGSVTVTPNSTVSMICQASQWYPAPTITWQINNTLADTLYYSTRYTPEANYFVTALSTFNISPESGLSLTCLASIQTLSQPQSATVNITVREHIPGSSYSLTQADIILIAVFASLGGLLLLIVIIVVVIFCCKKKKRKKTESGYQSDAWKTHEKNDSNLRTVQNNNLGERNLAYISDPVSIRQSFDSINDSNSPIYDNKPSTSTVSSLQVPARKWADNSLRKIRHVTHV